MKHPFSHMYHSRNREVNEMYISVSLRSFALSLVGIFVPIYLYTLGYSLRTIFLLYILTNAFQFVGDYLMGFAIARFGAKHMLILSYPVTAIHLLTIATISIFHWPIWFIALPTALCLNLFWVPFHDDFSKAKDKKATGKQVGGFLILTEIFGAISPLIGGFIAQKFGFQYGVMVALVLIIVSIVPLVGKKEIVKRRKIHHSFAAFKKNWKDMAAYGGVSLEGMALGVLWPLFIFLFIKNYAKVGILVTFSLLVVVFLSLIIGKLTDRYKKEKMMKMGSIVTFCTSATRIIASSTTAAYVVSTVSSMSQIFLYIPFFSHYYLHADTEPRTEYVSMMEMSVDVFRGILYIILFFATFFLADRWVFVIAFIFAALGALSSRLIARSKREEVKIEDQREIVKPRI